MLSFPIKIKKPYSELHADLFALKTMILWKQFYPISSLHAAVTSFKKWGKCNVPIIYKTQKTNFRTIFVQKPSARFFQKKSSKPILNHFAAVNSCKNSERFHALIFQFCIDFSILHINLKSSKQSFSPK